MLSSILPPDRRLRIPLLVGVGATAVIIAAANVGVSIPINDWVTWGHIIFPCVFLVTDVYNRLFGAAEARRMVCGGVIVAVIISAMLAEPRVAFASGAAYAAGQLLDVAIFDRLRHGTWWQAPAVSSSLASVVDTVMFYSLAFGGTAVPWVNYGLTDLAIKMGMVFPLLVPFRVLVLAVQRWRGGSQLN